MYTDGQLFKRCCFCVPLRYGLLVWGYIKMIPIVFVIDAVLRALFSYAPPIDDFAYIATCIVILVEFVFNLIFIVAAHIKNVKLLKACYFFAILESLAIVGFVAVVVYFDLKSLTRTREPLAYFQYFTLRMFVFLGTVIILDFYLILMIRSEVRKLEKENLTCSFVNNEAEGRCEIETISELKNNDINNDVK